MIKLCRFFIAACLGAVLLLPAFGVSQADEPRHIFYNVTTDETWAAGMALAQANVAAGRGHRVTVFLNVRAVHLADKDAVQSTFGPAGKTPVDLMRSLMNNGHTILVCGTCMKAGGVAASDLIDGAKMTGPNMTFGALTKPGTIVMSY